MICHVSVLSDYDRPSMDPISVAYFDQVAFFSDFHHLVELFDTRFCTLEQ